MLPQDSNTGGMERADPESPISHPPSERHVNHPFEPLPHLVRSFVGESDRQDIARIYVPTADQVRNPAGDNPGLAATCTGKDQERSVTMQYGLALGRIQTVQIIHRTFLSDEFAQIKKNEKNREEHEANTHESMIRIFFSLVIFILHKNLLQCATTVFLMGVGIIQR
jgi:hypothetical protein